ncbi:MAG: hypothetical protein J7M05_04795 [Anaerolineae bacterium]|nr:hypothetical protein [Anaerolineae bacterium]
MDSRERVRRILWGEIPDRIPLDDAYWETTIARWHKEGLPAGVSPKAFFGTDEIVRLGGDYSLQLPERTVKEEGNARTYWDREGALRRDLHTPDGWTSQWLDFSIKGPKDWAKYRQHLRFNESRIPKTALQTYRQARAEGKFLCYFAHACFHPTWMRIGITNMFVWMLDRPNFIFDLLAAHTQLVIDIYEGMRKLGIEFDGVFLADDLGHRTAPLISPQLYRQLVFPHHKRLCEHFQAQGLKVILHSDGNVAPLIPLFLEAGFTALHPLEAKAGLDVRTLKKEYGDRLVLYGNIDVRKLAGSKEEIEKEIASKIPIAKENGGYIYHSDHSVPHDVSFENYAFAIELVRRYGSYE